MSKDADFVKFVGRLMASKGNLGGQRPLVRKFYTRRTAKEILEIVRKIERLGYGEQTDYLKKIGATRSNLQYWRKVVHKWKEESDG